MLNTLVGLLFPNLCVGCNGVLLAAEQHICAHCINHLPETKFHTLPENQLEKAFWGRVNIERAYSFLVFRKQGIVQNILHELKYRNNPDLGVMLGQIYGSKLREYGMHFDAIVAIPLHEKKEKKRGYNQSDCFAHGLAQSLKCEHLKNVIVRDKFTETQTKKARFDRWLNVGDVFGIKSPSLIQNKKVLLVDDVITTGATIEACAQPILEHTPHLSVASIACVVNQ